MKHDMRATTFEHPLPCHLEAERMTLGVMILDNSTIEQTAHILTPEDYFLASHQAIYRAILKMCELKRPIDPVGLCDELMSAGRLEAVGGGAYIASLIDGVPRFSRIDNYVRLVLKASRERRLICYGNAVMGRAFDGEEEIDDQLAQAERELLSLGESRGESHWRDISGVAFDVMCEAEKRGETERNVLDFSTGFHDLDYVTLGLERKTMVVIGAAPGMGKTALGLSLTQHISESPLNRDEAGRPPVIAWFSLEMPKEQQAQRLLASMARVDLRNLRLGRLNRDQWRAVTDATTRLAGWRVHFDDRVGLSPRKMREAIRRLKQEEGRVDVAFVDYIQLGDGEKQKGETREQEVGKISRGLVGIAKDYNLTMIALSQLNRELEKRADKRPALSDFRDSGQIAQDAYLLMGLYRDQVYNPESPKQNIAELIILKQRNGPLCTIETVFLSQVMRFEDKFRP